MIALERKTRELRTLLALQLAGVLAEYKATCLETTGIATIDVVPRLVHTSVRLHVDNLRETSHTITAPIGGPSYFDEEYSDDDDDFNISGTTMVVMRSFCAKCCASLEQVVLASPTELTWQNHRATPDDCPLCHRVLFKKTLR